MKRFNKIKTINNALSAEGVNAELIRGDGYFYFVGSDVEQCETTSVMVNSLNELSLAQWVEEALSLKADHQLKVALLTH